MHRNSVFYGKTFLKIFFLKMVSTTLQTLQPLSSKGYSCNTSVTHCNTFKRDVRRKMVSENKKPVENTIGKVGRPAGLTERQKTFARYYVEGKRH